MLTVDAQVHLWGADTPERPWPKQAEPQRPVPLGANELLHEMNAAGVGDSNSRIADLSAERFRKTRRKRTWE